MPNVEKVRMFRAKRAQLLFEVVAVIVAGVVLVIWKGAAINWFFAVFLLGYLSYRFFPKGITLKTVRLRSDGVDIVPLLPGFRARRWQSEELATYKSVAFRGRINSRSFMGILTPKEGKPETIWASGTEGFSILDESLSKLLPPTLEQGGASVRH